MTYRSAIPALLCLLAPYVAQAYLPTREDLQLQCQSRRNGSDVLAVNYALLTSTGREEIQLITAPDAWAWNYDPSNPSPAYEWHEGKFRNGVADARIQTPAPIRFDAFFAQRCDAMLTALEKAGINFSRAETLVHSTERRSAVLYGERDVNWVAFDRVSYRPVAAQWIVSADSDLPDGVEPGAWWRVLYEFRYRDIRSQPDTIVITRELMPAGGTTLSGISQTGYVAPPVLAPTEPLDRAQITLKRLDQPTRIPDPRKGTSRARGRG